MNMRSGPLVLLAGLALTLGCSETKDEDGQAPAPTSFESTYAALQTQLFEGQGCTEAACHGSGAAGGLELTADKSYEQLVSITATGSTAKNLPITPLIKNNGANMIIVVVTEAVTAGNTS